MPELDSPSFPTNYVAKEDLLSVRPDLKEQILALADSEVERIADKVGDALTETYWIALPIILNYYLGVSEIKGNVDETDEEL